MFLYRSMVFLTLIPANLSCLFTRRMRACPLHKGVVQMRSPFAKPSFLDNPARHRLVITLPIYHLTASRRFTMSEDSVYERSHQAWSFPKGFPQVLHLRGSHSCTTCFLCSNDRRRLSKKHKSRASSGSSSRTAAAIPSQCSGHGSRLSGNWSSISSRSNIMKQSWRRPGKQAEKSLTDVVKNQKGKYIAIVEGTIPTEGRRRLLHDRRQDSGGHRTRGLRQCGCDPCGRFLRGLGRHHCCPSEPDRRRRA